jgi:FkbM family methyltransferase
MKQRLWGTYERELSEFIRSNLTRGDCYVDIGSNKGYHAFKASSIVGEQGRVICFEPYPENFEILEENIRLNGFDNIDANQIAVVETEGMVQFKPGEYSGWGKVTENGSIKVEATSFDCFLDRRSISPTSIDLVKVDVEGREGDVITGMKDFLESSTCEVVLEVHPSTDIERMTEVLHNVGADFEMLNDEFWRISI